MSIFLLRRIQNKSKWLMEDVEKKATAEFLQKIYNRENTTKIDNRITAIWHPSDHSAGWITSPISFR